MSKEEFDEIANKIITKSMEVMLREISEHPKELTDRELIVMAHRNAVVTARDLLFEYHQRLELYLNERIPR